MGSYSDYKHLKKGLSSAKLRNASEDHQNSYQKELKLNLDLNKQLIPELTKWMLEGFANARPDPDVATLVKFIFTHEDNEVFYTENYYLLNPEGYMPPSKIKKSDIKDLVDCFAKEITSVQNEKKAALNDYSVIIIMFPVY